MNVLISLLLLIFVLTGPAVGQTASLAGAWNALPSMLHTRLDHGMAVVDDRVYVMGGASDSDSTFILTTSVEMYDPATGVWSDRSPMPAPRGSFAVAVWNHQIFVIGGQNGAYAGPVMIYDPGSDTWTTGADILTPRTKLDAAAVDGKIFTFGGDRPETETALEVYDPSSDRWEALPDMPTPRRNPRVVTLGSLIYVVGGETPDGYTAVAATERFDPRNGSWSTLQPMATPRTDFGLGIVNDRIVVAGGWTNQGLTSLVEEYDIRENAWYPAAGLPDARHFHAVAAVGNHLYVTGGTVALPSKSRDVFVFSR